MSDLFVTLGGFVLLLALVVGLRMLSGNRFEVKTSDIVLALIPIALWLFVTGKVKTFQYGELKIESAFVLASKEAVAAEVQWRPADGTFAFFPGSTIPHIRYVRSSVERSGGGANQLMTGYYPDYRKGVHKGGAYDGARRLPANAGAPRPPYRRRLRLRQRRPRGVRQPFRQPARRLEHGCGP